MLAIVGHFRPKIIITKKSQNRMLYKDQKSAITWTSPENQRIEICNTSIFLALQVLFEKFEKTDFFQIWLCQNMMYHWQIKWENKSNLLGPMPSNGRQAVNETLGLIVWYGGLFYFSETNYFRE